jgi:hypothetical protein
MSNDEAKFILNAYRPGGRDANDPAMAPALAQAKNDPALSAWWARQQAHDAAVAAKLRAVVPPAGLRDAILAGARMSGRDGAIPGAEAGRASAKRAWWSQPVWLAAAAVLAVLVSLAAWRMAPVRGEAFEEFAVNFVDKGFMLQKRGADVAALKAWLGEQRGPLPEALPAKFAELRALGCRTLRYRGQDVSLMCFEREGKEFHVFVARRGDVPSLADDIGRIAATEPRLVAHSESKLAAATWSDAKNFYVLVSDAEMDVVKRLL